MSFLDKFWKFLGIIEEEELEEEEDKPTEKVESKKTGELFSRVAARSNPFTSKESTRSAQPELNQLRAENRNNNVLPLHPVKQQGKLIVLTPKVFDDAQIIADHIREAKAVVVIFKDTEADVMKRIIDFISGTVYALNGNIHLVGNDTMICAPNNFDVEASKELWSGKDFSPWRE